MRVDSEERQRRRISCFRYVALDYCQQMRTSLDNVFQFDIIQAGAHQKFQIAFYRPLLRF